MASLSQEILLKETQVNSNEWKIMSEWLTNALTFECIELQTGQKRCQYFRIMHSVIYWVWTYMLVSIYHHRKDTSIATMEFVLPLHKVPIYLASLVCLLPWLPDIDVDIQLKISADYPSLICTCARDILIGVLCCPLTFLPCFPDISSAWKQCRGHPVHVNRLLGFFRMQKAWCCTWTLEW